MTYEDRPTIEVDVSDLKEMRTLVDMVYTTIGQEKMFEAGMRLATLREKIKYILMDDKVKE